MAGADVAYLRLLALLGVALATGSGESSHAGVIGPGDFGPGAVVQTFDSLSENYLGAYGPLILSGVTYATSLPGTYNIASGLDCFSGQCFGTRSTGAGLIIVLENPVERVGGYLHGRGDQTPYVTFYDANHVGIDGLYPNQVSADGFFFGFHAGANNIKYIEITPNAGQGIATLDNFTYQIASPVPEPATWAMLLFGFAGVGFLAYRKRPKSQSERAQLSAEQQRA